MDSDAILINDIDFIDDDFCTICEIGDSFGNKRVMPMIQYINVGTFRNNNLIFCDKNRIRYGLDPRYVLWDTGTCLLYDIVQKHLPIGFIKMNDYINHMSGASWEQIRSGTNITFKRIEDFVRSNNV